MQKYLEVLRKVKLFSGIDNDLSAMLDCLGSEKKSYLKGEMVILAGQAISSVGIVLSGELQVIQEDYNGNRAILTELGPTQIFGEALACAGIQESPVSVLSKSDTEVLFIGVSRIINTCSNSCVFHNRLIENLLRILARKNIGLSDKNRLLSHRSIREKVLSYLSMHAEKNNASDFDVPFNRNEMADFLCVDRSALSRVLSSLAKEGVISVSGRHFTLH
ncbi:MAG: family transcriptional regulator, dissimilatory nitrate respiration regulator [Eubacteriaceae bacterium]|jgi:CRP-like cAMP-binding protein|nr:family transcriptional regulator, dissimilatory nitrate respiration regulator [Eubacteriaceae bacterium]